LLAGSDRLHFRGVERHDAPWACGRRTRNRRPSLDKKIGSSGFAVRKNPSLRTTREHGYGNYPERKREFLALLQLRDSGGGTSGPSSRPPTFPFVRSVSNRELPRDRSNPSPAATKERRSHPRDRIPLACWLRFQRGPLSRPGEPPCRPPWGSELPVPLLCSVHEVIRRGRPAVGTKVAPFLIAIKREGTWTVS
jgi:hypothetical protein